MRAAKPTDWNSSELPDQRSTVPLDCPFSTPEMEKIRQGLIPEVMEDKWFIYWENDCLHFHRSWTGICVYVVKFADQSGQFRMVEAQINRDPEQYEGTSDEYDARMISYLVDILLLRQPAEFPIDKEPSDMDVLKTWSAVGRAMLGEHPEDPE